MEETIYIDTNVYLDYFWGRKDYLRDLGDFAFLVLRKSLDCRYKIVISDWLTFEMDKYIEKSKSNVLLEQLKAKNKIVNITRTKEDIKKAREISKEHPDDALHAILAKKAGAICVITRNLSHYAGTESIIDVKLPENL